MNKFFVAATAAAVIFLGYLFGAGAMYFRGPGADYVEGIFKLLEASGVVEAQRKLPSPLFVGGLPPRQVDGNRPPAPNWELGLQVYDKDRVQPGYTVYTSVGSWSPVRLIDMEGTIIHEWNLPRELAVIEDRDDGLVFPRPINPPVTDVHVYPNGNLLVALGNDLGFPPFGYAVVMLDKDSNVLWIYSKDAHHRVNVSETGEIAVLLNDWVKTPRKGLESIPVPFREDLLAILNPDGTEITF